MLWYFFFSDFPCFSFYFSLFVLRIRRSVDRPKAETWSFEKMVSIKLSSPKNVLALYKTLLFYYAYELEFLSCSRMQRETKLYLIILHTFIPILIETIANK